MLTLSKDKSIRTYFRVTTPLCDKNTPNVDVINNMMTQVIIIGEQSEPSVGRWMENLYCCVCLYVVYIYIYIYHTFITWEYTQSFTDSTKKKKY